jgi:aconitate hydratase
LAGSVDFDFETQPLGQDQTGKDVFLRDIWPSIDEVNKLIEAVIHPKMFIDVYKKISDGTPNWNSLNPPNDKTYTWDEDNTYIHHPPFFSSLGESGHQIPDIANAYCLLNLGDSITTDHISPAGKISLNSPAARFLQDRGVQSKDFNTYGARRGNDEIMARGTFANIRLVNKLLNGEVGPNTIHHPSGEKRSVYDAANEYILNNQQTIILAGKEYGSGSSRDWAAKGSLMLGVKGVIAQSFERIHRSNLVGMGVLPMTFLDGENADSLGLNGTEQFNIVLNNGNLQVGQKLTVTTNTGKSFQVNCRLDTALEVEYYKNGGILHYVL